MLSKEDYMTIESQVKRGVYQKGVFRESCG